MPGQNIYPATDNYPESSFKSPVPPPTVDPDEGDLLLVAYNPAWQEVLLGACMQLLNPSTWLGTDEEKKLAMDRAETLRYMLTVSLQNEAPYWDDEDGADASDEDNPDDFPWYENVSDFIVTSFLSLGITPGAAIQFVGTARQFRLAWRRSGFGGIVRVFLNDVLQADVDTYSPVEDLTFLDVFADPAGGFSAFAADPWALRIVNTGTANPLATPIAGGYKMETIRKRLWSGEVSPENLRYNEETDEVEYSPDGGETWAPAPGDDPRHVPKFRFPPLAPSDAACQAAANMVLWIEEFIEEVLFMLAAGGVVISIVTLIAGLLGALGPWAIVLPLLFPIAQIIYDAGSTAVSGAMTPEMFNILECILYCNIGDNGQVSASQLATIKSEINAQIGGLADAILDVMFFAMGEVGLSNTGTIGSAPADCDECDCDWCYDADFGVSDHYFTSSSGVWTPLPMYSGGQWNAMINGTRSGFTDSYSQLTIGRLIGGQLTRLEIYHTLTWGVQDAYNQSFVIKLGSETLATYTYPSTPPNPIVWTGDEDATGRNIAIEMGIGYNNTGGLANGAGAVQRIVFSGTGTNKIGENNCEVE